MTFDIEAKVDDVSIAKQSLKILNPSHHSTFQNPSQHFEYNISDLSPHTLDIHEKRLYQFATRAHLNGVQIHFYGLEQLRKICKDQIHERWDLKDTCPLESKLYDMLNTIQMQSNVSSRRYYIKVVN